MHLAVVRGRATATVRHPSLEGARLLICQLLDAAAEPAGDPVLAVDCLGAGFNDRVLLTTDSSGGQKLLDDLTSPLVYWTIGIVDA